ncbi:N-6 DNA methylase [Trichocoleus sp. DQ-U1]|uniref:Eco57I restriction-modification methylase domain-containing protein n=1 Tax=Trichocoleus sp. DQ-U1 TaxID=2933926 RepID=UPI003296EA9A
MSNRVERLTQLRRHEQDSKGYAPSSRWYTKLSYALKFLERAETETDHINRFREAWFAIYNLSMMIQIPGEEENKTLIKLSKELETAPAIRSLSQDFPTSFLELLLTAKKQLLWDAQRNQWRESKQCVESWLQKRQKSQELSPEKACTYVFLILRDLRNTVSHFDSNPSSSATKKALNAAADQFIPLAAAAIETIIERPIKGTTGRTIAYHSFLYPFLKNSDSFFSDYYLERLFPEEELADFAEAEVKEQLRGIAREWRSRQSTLRTANENTTRQLWYESVLFPALGTTVHQGVTLVAEDGVFDPTYVLVRTDSGGTPQAEYQGKDAKGNLACLFWVLPWLTSLDAISTNPEFESLPVMEVAHRALTASDVPWAILTNGQQLRLLSRRTAHKPRCFLEIDLAAVIDRRGDTEALLSFRYLLGLFAGASFIEEDEQGRTRLDRVVAGSDRHGQEISDELKQNVFGALEEIGDGFLDYLRNHSEELEAWRQKKHSAVAVAAFLNSEQLLTDIYQESLSLMYRLLFLFYAESRNLLPIENEIYRDSYSLESIRDDIISVLDDPDPTKFYGKGDTQLWQRLQELFGLVNQGGLGTLIPAYNGGLFDPELHQFLEQFQVGDYHLSRAIDLLSRTRPSPNRPRGGRIKVTYRDLDIRHLGSIYEGILEYSAHIADQELVVMKRGSNGKNYDEYVSVSELKAEERQQLQAYREATEENPENPKLPKRCKVVGVKPQGSYFLVYGSRESKRKSSGSYYTPDYIVQYIVENTLGSLVAGKNREGELQNVPLTADEILGLKVLDPAMGSGHFLVAATEFLARAYGEALIKKPNNNEAMSDEEFVRYKRIVAERCIYGVDLNPMAVELAKLSMWLFTMDRNCPLSFLNHHLKCGNSLIGAWIDDLAELPEPVRQGKPKKRQKSPGQLNMFKEQFKAQVPGMVKDLFRIMDQETLTYQDVQDKKVLAQAIEEKKRPFKSFADMWVGTFFGEQARDYYALLTNVDLAKNHQSPAAQDNNFFNWELEFPEVWFEESGQLRNFPGFDCICQNPPWGATFNNLAKVFLLNCFKEIIVRIPNSFMYFVLQATRLLSKNSYLGFVLPDTLLSQPETERVRDCLSEEFNLERVVNLGSGVFVQPDGSEPTAPACIVSVSRPLKETKVGILDISQVNKDEKPAFLNSKNLESIPKSAYLSLPGKRFLATDCLEEKLVIASKCYGKGRLLLEDIKEDLSQGITTGGDYAFVINIINNQIKIEEKVIKKTLTGSYLKPYLIQDCPLKVIYTNANFKPELFPQATKHLMKFRPQLENKVETRQGIRPWYRLHRARDEEKLSFPKILIRQTADRLVAALDREGLYVLDSLYFITLKNAGISSIYTLEILEALLNSSVWNFLYMLITQEKGRVFSQVKAENVKCLPIPKPDELEDLKDALQQKPIKISTSWQNDIDFYVSLAFGLTLSDHTYIRQILGRA